MNTQEEFKGLFWSKQNSKNCWPKIRDLYSCL